MRQTHFTCRDLRAFINVIVLFFYLYRLFLLCHRYPPGCCLHLRGRAPCSVHHADFSFSTLIDVIHFRFISLSPHRSTHLLQPPLASTGYFSHGLQGYQNPMLNILLSSVVYNFANIWPRTAHYNGACIHGARWF